MNNKKGNIMIIIMFIFILFVILFLGFIMLVGSSVMNYVFDIAVPELSNLGMVGNVNTTQVAGVTIAPLNNLVQSFTWMSGVLYVLLLIFSIVFVMVMKIAPNKWLIGFFFLCALILIIGSIFMSNIYEDFYDDAGSDLSTRLHEHTLLSYMVLYSPAIFSVMVFLVGIILFSGLNQEEYM